MGLTSPEMHYFLFNLSPKNHLRSTLFSLLNHCWCIYLVDPLTLAGTTAHPSIACDSLIFYVICRGPSYSFASKNHTGQYYFLRIYSALSDGQSKKKITSHSKKPGQTAVLYHFWNEWRNEIAMNRVNCPERKHRQCKIIDWLLDKFSNCYKVAKFLELIHRLLQFISFMNVSFWN